VRRTSSGGIPSISTARVEVLAHLASVFYQLGRAPAAKVLALHRPRSTPSEATKAVDRQQTERGAGVSIIDVVVAASQKNAVGAPSRALARVEHAREGQFGAGQIDRS